MIRWVSPKYLWLVVVSLCIVDLLLGISVYQAYVTVDGDQSEPPAGLPGKEGRVTDFLPPHVLDSNMASFREMILEGNLLHPSRSRARIAPIQPEEQAQPAIPPPEKSQLELVGILISPHNRQAFIQNRNAPGDTPKKKWLKEGEKFWGVKMAGISREAVTLESEPAKRFTLDLYEAARKKERGEALKQDPAKSSVRAVEPPAPPKPKSEPRPSQAKPVEKASDRENVTVISTPFGDYTLPQGKGQAPGSTTKTSAGSQ